MAKRLNVNSVMCLKEKLILAFPSSRNGLLLLFYWCTLILFTVQTRCLGECPTFWIYQIIPSWLNSGSVFLVFFARQCPVGIMSLLWWHQVWLLGYGGDCHLCPVQSTSAPRLRGDLWHSEQSDPRRSLNFLPASSLSLGDFEHAEMVLAWSSYDTRTGTCICAHTCVCVQRNRLKILLAVSSFISCEFSPCN